MSPGYKLSRDGLEMKYFENSSSKVFAHADVTPPVGPPYWITAIGLYPLLPFKIAKFSN